MKNTNVAIHETTNVSRLGSNGTATFYRAENGLIFTVPNDVEGAVRERDMERWFARGMQELERICAAHARVL